MTTYPFSAEQPNDGNGSIGNVEIQLGELTARLSSFSEAKDPSHPEANEDAFRCIGNTIVLADGATSKNKASQKIGGLSGGAIAAQLVCRAVTEVDLNGVALVNYVSGAMRDFYNEYNREALEDPKHAFAATFVVARVLQAKGQPWLVVTRVGDTGFRLNGGRTLYRENRTIDEIDARGRAGEIRRLLAEGVPEAEAALRGRAAIEDSLGNQYRLWNNPRSPLGFGYVNGYHVPDKFIHGHTFALRPGISVELVTDGYPKLAAEPTVESWEAAYAEVQRDDPYRYKEFPATKPADDRTVTILNFLT